MNSGRQPLGLRLGSWIAAQADIHYSSRVEQRAEEILLDALGCATAGSRFDQYLVLDSVLNGGTTTGNAVLIGRPLAARCSSERAALLNAVASNIVDADDTHLPTMLHLESAIVPALLALSTVSAISGIDMIRGIVAGYEVATAIVKREHYDHGWHGSGTVGCLAVAAASSAALRLNAQRSAVAMSIAASLAAGLRANFGTATKALHLGHAASSGLLAARLALAGFTAQTTSLDGESGFARVFGGIATDVDLPVGEPTGLLQTSFKPYPCGIVTHPILEAALELGRRFDRRTDGVAKVVISVDQLTRNLARFDAPQDGLEARLSLTHSAAIGLMQTCGIESFTDKAASNPKVVEVRQTCEVEVDPRIDFGSTSVCVTTQSGRVLEQRVITADGSPGRPLTRSRLIRKFRDYFAYGYSDECSRRVIEVVFNLRPLKDMNRLTRLLEAE